MLFSSFLFLIFPLPSRSTLFPYTTLFRSCHDSCPPSPRSTGSTRWSAGDPPPARCDTVCHCRAIRVAQAHRRTVSRSEEHTSELQSHSDLVCRLLLEKKKKKI